ncbi:MAG: IPTL-CTERM sorting domain-containing protein [Thermoanaerobaculia bacterium]|nr:IPTL-CTERM sorting domain-containing protein [Thermoanaerobaculia bacterium]
MGFVWRGVWLLAIVASSLSTAFPALAQPLQKSAIQVDPGNTKLTGATFGYRLSYRCNATVGNCLNAVVADTLPPEVVFVSAVGTSDVASISSPAPGATGTVTFTMVTPLTAGNSGDLIINVRFPNGSTPDGTVATNTATATNLAPPAGPFTTPPVSVTAVATPQISLQKTLLTGPANLDLPESYRLRVSVSGNDGSLNLTAVGPVTDTLPPGTVFNGATPAADCQPGCVGTTPATVTWTSPCALPVPAGGSCDVTVNVTFPSATFPSGTNVTNSFTAAGTPLGEPAIPSLGVGSVTHPVTTFVADPRADLSKGIEGSSPNPPTLNQTFRYQVSFSNSGNVPLDNLVVIDTLPIELLVGSVTTGAYSGAADFAPGVGVRVSYEKNTAPGVFTFWGSSPNATTNTTLTAPPPGLGAGEYLTRIRWELGAAAVGMAPSSSPQVIGQITNPDRAGGPVAFGDSIQNCVDLSAVYTPGPTNVARNACNTFTLSGPFVQLNPAKENLSGGGPFLPGQTVAFRLRVRSAPQSSDPVPVADLVATDLLPVDLSFSNWSFDDRGTGLPTPQVFDQIPNFAGTGRTLLRWRWNAGSGNLGVLQEVWINIQVTLRNGVRNGVLNNDFHLEHDNPGLGQRCSGGSVSDPLDFDADANTAETLCRATGGVTIAPVAQLVSSKTTRGACDAGFTASSLGTLHGGAIDYRLAVQNVGTIPMNQFVLVDILPFPGDTGVLDTNPRLSQWAPILTAPITPPPGTTVFYSLSGNPCRPEVGGPVSGCDPPNWTTVPPVPISNARSFKVEFGGRVIDPYDTLFFDFRMTVPTDAPTGGLAAFNSFAYLTERSDGIGNLSAEPNKVGMTIGTCPGATLGDFVWVDTNGNGLQDDGATGVNDVFVQLFDPGADGLVRTADDRLVSTTVTADDVGGAPGWYQFPALPAGNYYVRIAPPPNYELTTPDAGADGADSDGDVVTACSPVVVLGAADSNQTVDFGLLPPTTAALGNYVFFDADTDGLQDGPRDFGVNGVAVKLFADNGNGVAEPGGADGAPIAATATANDVYGNPGYYLFEDLIPGVAYFVQFLLPPSASGFTTQNAGGNDAVDSDANPGNGVTQLAVLAAGETNLTVDAGLVLRSGPLSLGNQVWMDTDNDSVYEPELGEMGLDGVRLDLYLDANGDGLATLDEYVTTTETETRNGFAGRYEFRVMAGGNYLVLIPASNFAGDGALAGKTTATGNDPAPDPDDDRNGDDNGSNSGALVVSRAVTLSTGGEPTTDGDNSNNSNLTVDFGFITGSVLPQFDYGDDPDVIAGTALSDYRTTALDAGAAHGVGLANAPYLGACVDADPGTQQSTAADSDDANSFGLVVGTCDVPGADEDGVTFSSPIVPGGALSVQVAAAPGTNDCNLSAWIDWNHDGDFADAGEAIATALSVAAGTSTTLTPTVPATALPGFTYTRFRCSTVAVAGPTGTAADGEVEDYRLAVSGTDLGDAPDSYGTLLASNGPVHTVDPENALVLGACVDSEADGQPNGTALGDDAAQGSPVGLCFDDEDGVTLNGMLIVCTAGSFTVAANAAGRLDAWVDFNRDGDFLDVGEQIATNQAVVAGSNNLPVAVACDAAPGTTFGRFRVSTAGALAPTGPAADGEVEDHAVLVKGADWGDDPGPFTLAATNGARHGVDPNAPRFLGSCVDTEPDGQVVGPSNNDDIAPGTSTVGTCAGGDDEDGVVFPVRLPACGNSSVNLTTNVGGGFVSAWIDFNRDGDWLDVGEQILTDFALPAGTTAAPFAVPCASSPGLARARFRYSTTTGLGFAGPAMDGEVEDYQVDLEVQDFGDAPDSYGTTFASDGPRHTLLPLTSFRLGSCVDVDGDAGTPLDATGDDVTASGATYGTCATPNDDEDGVVFTSMLVACKPLSMTVSASIPGRLDAWIDYNRDGDFGDPGEQIFNTILLAGGANNLTTTVPCAAAEGATYARFRLSTGGGLAPTGPATDGEVEDYAILATGADFGDAPDSYGTSFGANGPLHGVDSVSGLFLGACVDSEDDAGTPLDASGDDVTVGSVTVGTCAVANDDEDGVTFTTPVIACQAAGVTVTAGAAGRLDAWIDYNRDGDFNDAGEPIATNLALVAGPNTLAPVTPCTAVAGPTYSRFRFSPVGNLGPNGPTPAGEVEDHPLTIRTVDFGDAPDSYGTTLLAGGPNHGVLPGFGLGGTEDGEPNGQPSPGADGDGSDEDGVVLSNTAMFIACEATTVTVTLTNTASVATAVLDAWVDWDADGAFHSPRDRIATNLALVAGANSVPVTVPCDLVRSNSYARFRLSSTGVAGPGGAVTDGEVEDYAVVLKGLDYGDAPDPTYPTLLANDGARHVVAPGLPELGLGPAVDTEIDGQPSANHNGDDNVGTPDDEDAVTVPTVLIPGTQGQITVQVRVGTTPGNLSAWIDFNQDGDWNDKGENIVADQTVSATFPAQLFFQVPPGSPEGTACLRVRLSTATGLLPTGLAPDGEVEDHLVSIGVELPEIGVAKRAVSIVEESNDSFLVTFEIRLENLGNVPLFEVNATADLAAAFAPAAGFTVVSVTSGEFLVSPSFDGTAGIDLLDVGNSLEVGASGVVQLVVRVDPGGNAGPYLCTSVGRGSSPGDVDVFDDSQDGDDPDPDDDGDAGDDDEPTEIRFPINVLEIPTLGEYGLMLMALMLALAAGAVLRRR